MESISHQNNTSKSESSPVPTVNIEPEFTDFAPETFVTDPIGYFEREGKNIKKGEIKYDQHGNLREDPNAVKDLPVWKNSLGEELYTVGRLVNPNKGQIGVSGDTLYEYNILEQLARMGLPAAKPVAKAEQGGKYLIVAEKIPGFRWSERNNLKLREQGYTEEDVVNLIREAEEKISELKKQFDEAGVVRGWKLNDMVFQIDVENKKIFRLCQPTGKEHKSKSDQLIVFKSKI